jgi:predicted ATPase/DNA-binding SARP family transcriptional activator
MASTTAAIWRIELMGGLRAERDGQVLTRFHTRKTATLLGYLAYYLGREQPREVLIGLFWPDVDPESGRNSLNVALSSLRRLLEPPELAAGSVLETNSFSARLRPAAIVTDVGEFSAALRAAENSPADPERIRWLIQAVERYQGTLLPGYYDDWIGREQQRLGDQLMGALRRLSVLLEQGGEPERAIQYAQRAAALDPLHEEARRELMRLYAAAGQNAAALREFQDLERLLSDELRAAPSPTTRALAEQIRSTAAVPVGAAPRAGPEPLRPPPLAPAPPVFQPVVPRQRPEPLPPAPRLPLPLTRFVGRTPEIEQLVALLGAPPTEGPAGSSVPSLRPAAGARLLTLTGPGGSGKTRLALEAAARLREAFGGAVWFVPLADLADGGLVGARLRDTLGVVPAASEDPLAQVSAAVGDRAALLVLDNFEQLPEGSEAIVTALLGRCPRLACLVTSRRTLNLSGEREFLVRPLPVPDEGAAGWTLGGDRFARATPANAQRATPEALLEFPSVQLFVDRAQAAQLDFALSGANAGAVAQLCARLEGLPLAIELAAARAAVLTPAQMLGQLERGLASLVSRQRDVEPRHRTLYAAAEWSHRLLSPPLQRFFAALAVFRGGFTLEAAEAVAGEEMEEWKRGRMDEGVTRAASTLPLFHSPAPVLDALQQLRECSLILGEETPEGMRFGMLEVVRQFAEEQLRPEERAALRSRHRDWFLALASDIESHPHEPGLGGRLDRLEREHANFRAALEWCRAASPADPGAVQKGLALASHLGWFWGLRGYLRLGRECTADLLALEAAAPPTRYRARALNTLASLARMQGEGRQARPLFEEGLGIGRALGDKRVVSHALSALGGIAEQEGDLARARALYEEALAIKRASDDNLGLIPMLLALGRVTASEGDPVAARARYEEGVATGRRTGDYRCVAVAFDLLGRLSADQGDLEAAAAYYEQALPIVREVGEPGRLAAVLEQLGRLAARRGDPAEGRSLMTESLAIRRELGDRAGMAASLEGLGRLEVVEGRRSEARALLSESLSLRRDMGETRGILDLLEGLAALSAVDLAGTESHQAARLAGAAERLRSATGHRRPPSRQRDFDHVVALARAALGEAAFGARWTEGEGLSLERAVAVALADADPA